MKKYLFIFLALALFTLPAFGQNQTVIAGTTGGDAGSIDGVVIGDILRSDIDDSTGNKLQMGRCDLDSSQDYWDHGSDSQGFGTGSEIQGWTWDGATTRHNVLFGKGLYVFGVDSAMAWDQDGAGSDFLPRGTFAVDGIGSYWKNLVFFSYGTAGGGEPNFTFRTWNGYSFGADDIVLRILDGAVVPWSVDKEGDVNTLGSITTLGNITANTAQIHAATIIGDVMKSNNDYIAGNASAGISTKFRFQENIGISPSDWIGLWADNEVLQFDNDEDGIADATIFGTYSNKSIANRTGLGAGAAAPTQIIINNTLGFEMGIGDEIYFLGGIPDDYASGDITIEVVTFQTLAGTGTEYKIQADLVYYVAGDLVSGTDRILAGVDHFVPGVQWEAQTFNFPNIPASDFSAGEFVSAKLTRIAITDGTETGSPAGTNGIAVANVFFTYTATEDNSL